MRVFLFFVLFFFFFQAEDGIRDVAVTGVQTCALPIYAVVEQVIADLKDQALAHFPSGHFHANGAWTVLAALAHNLLRWTQLLGLPDTTVRAARTLRRRLLGVPGRLTRHARGWTLHLPARWPWHGDYISALNAIRALPAAA